MTLLKKNIRKLHLWLGLSSGVLVFLIAITGCLYAFKEEIQDLSQPFRFIKEKGGTELPPSFLQKQAESALPDKLVHAVMYPGADRSAKVIFYSDEQDYHYQVYVNQYTGEVLKVQDEETGFFHFILDGHFYLWLPEEMGKQVVAGATLVFFFMMISGLFLWWPKKTNYSQRFKIRLNSKWRRKNFDLHSVLGFYVMWVGIIFATTGLVWGYEWFMRSYYAAISGGEQFIDYSAPQSGKAGVGAWTTIGQSPGTAVSATDRVWMKMKKEYPQGHAIEVHPPENAISCIAANANPERGTYYKTDYRYFDQYTLEELSVGHIWGRYSKADAAAKLMRMNYDIHVGAIFGFAGKIFAFLASLVIASLPVTGFLMWWGRRNKKKAVVPSGRQPVTSRKVLAEV